MQMGFCHIISGLTENKTSTNAQNKSQRFISGNITQHGNVFVEKKKKKIQFDCNLPK